MMNISASICRWLSFSLYIAAMGLPAYYIGETREPQVAGVLLLIGWLGPIDGHFSWFANLAYIFAQIKYKQHRLSALLGFIAAALALSFLLHKTIIASEAPTYARITAYGWGYFLWTTSICIFLIDRLSRFVSSGHTINNNLVVITLQLLIISIATLVFIQHHYFNEDSQYKFEIQRDLIYKEKCINVGEIIYKNPKLVNGLFFDNGWGARVQNIKNTNRWYLLGVGESSVGLLNSGFIKFYEEKNSASASSKNKSMYVRHEKTSGAGVPTEELSSEYAIVNIDMNIPSKFNIIGGELVIVDLEDNSVLAKNTYVFNGSKESFCGHSINGYFDTGLFIMRALKLEKRFPSAFDRKP